MSNTQKRKAKTLNQIAQTNFVCVNILFHARKGDLFNLNLRIEVLAELEGDAGTIV